MSDVSLLKGESKVGLLAVVMARILYVGFIVVACLALPLTRELANGEYSFDEDGGTLYVPLLICTPTSVDVNNSTVSFDASGRDECYTLEFLVNACLASLFLSALATLLFVVLDATTRCGKGPFRRSSLASMSLFLMFILLQTGLCVGAVVQQARFWEAQNENLVGLLQQGNSTATSGYDNVSTYGNTTFLFAVAIVALATAFVALFEFAAGLFCSGSKIDDTFNDPNKSLAVLQKSNELNQSNDLSSSSALDTSGGSLYEDHSQQLVGPTVTDQSGRPSWITGV